MEIFGLPNIERLEAKKNVKELIKALSYHKDDTIRQAATEALVRIGAPAVEPLNQVLGDSDKDVRYAAVLALGRIGGKGAELRLNRALFDSEKDVRQAAINFLVQIGPPAVKPFINNLELRQYRSEAAEALARIGTPAVEPLIAKLKSTYNDVRTVTAQVLGQIGDARAASPLITLFKDGYSDVRQAAIDSLVQIGAPAVAPLIDVLQVITEGVRPAAKALVRIGEPAVKPLIGALEDPDKTVREAAAYILGDIGDNRAVEPLIGALGDPEKTVREAATYVLGKIGDRRAVEYLVIILRDENEWSVRRAAASALAKLGWKPDQDATGAIYWIARHQYEECIQIGEPAVEPLITALFAKDLDERMHAAEALGQIGDARAVDSLIAAISENRVQQAAADALVQIGTPAVKPLIALLKHANVSVREIVAQALVQLGDPYPVDRLIAVSPAFHGSIISDLLEIGAPAVEPLIGVLNDVTGTFDRDQRYRAAEALVRISQQKSLDQELKESILAMRKVITKQSRHYDSQGGCGPPTDETSFVKFPL